MKNQHDRIGIEFISVFGLPPVEFVQLAAGLGCRHIALALAPILQNHLDYPVWSLREDANLRREVSAAMRDCGVGISLGEGFLLRPGADMSAVASDMNLLRELGAPRVNVVSFDSERGRGLDQLAAFAEMAEARGLDATVEFVPGLPIADLPTALAAIAHVGKPNFKVLIDAMHLFRSGATAVDVAALDPALIGYAQLCDVPLTSHLSYADEARYERLPPGEGELPLLDLLAALPRDMVVGLETPMLGEAKAGGGPLEPMSRCVAATRQLLARLG